MHTSMSSPCQLTSCLPSKSCGKGAIAARYFHPRFPALHFLLHFTCYLRKPRSCKGQTQRVARSARSAAGREGTTRVLNVDVAIIGAGVVGLFVARRLLQQYPELSVALLERHQLCAGATGAGQGYIWMAHRQPQTPGWALAKRGKSLWESMLDESVQGSTIAEQVEWQDTGSMLIGATPEETAQLSKRQELLAQHGVDSQFLDSKQLKEAEPALYTSANSSALLCPGDAQLNGRQAACTLLQHCKELGAGGRFVALLEENVQQLQVTDNTPTLLTQYHRVHSRRGVVLAAGVWSGQLLSRALGDASWHTLVQPRRGYLLELDRCAFMPPLKHGMMELSYTQHYMPGQAAADVAITFTATTSASGTLLVGSSREMGEWDATVEPNMVQAILDHAARFLPDLSFTTTQRDSIRVGLRPYAVGGLPIIGPVPEIPGLFLAAGHEGSGLCMAPATSELLCAQMLESPRAVEREWSWAADLLPAQRKANLAGNA